MSSSSQTSEQEYDSLDLCLQRSIEKLIKREPKPKLNSAYKLRLNRKICNSKHIGKKGKLQEIDKLV